MSLIPFDNCRYSRREVLLMRADTSNSTAVCNELRGAYLADFLLSKFYRTNLMVICRIFPPKFDRFHTTEIYVIRYNSLFLNRTNHRKVKASRAPFPQPCLAQINHNGTPQTFLKNSRNFINDAACEQRVYFHSPCAANFIALLNLLKGKV